MNRMNKTSFKGNFFKKIVQSLLIVITFLTFFSNSHGYGCSTEYSNNDIYGNNYGFNSNPRSAMRQETAEALDRMTLYLRQQYGDNFKLQLNSITGGVHEGAGHYDGRAFDIQLVPGGAENRKYYIAAAKKAGFTAFGFKDTYIHVEVREGSAHWCYSGSSECPWEEQGVTFSPINYTPQETCEDPNLPEPTIGGGGNIEYTEPQDQCTPTESSDTSCILSEHNVITSLAASKCNVTDPKKINNMCSYMKAVAQYESEDENDNQNYCWKGAYKDAERTKKKYEYYNPKTTSKEAFGCISGNNTAKGYYQFIDATFAGTLNNIQKIDPGFPVKSSIVDYTRAEQSQFAATLWATSNTSLFCGVFDKDPQAGYDNYCTNHHTDCDGGQINESRHAYLEKLMEDWSGCQLAEFPETSGGNLGNGANNVDFGEPESLDAAYFRQCLNKNNGGIVNYDGPICSRDENVFVSFIELVKRTLVYLQGLGIIAAVVMVMRVGFLMLTEGERSGSVQRAKDILKNVLIGLFFMFTAWLIVTIITVGLGADTLDLLNNNQ